MEILILGTSNSLLRNGWVSGLQEAMPQSTVTNKSVGASPGTQFCGLINMDFSKYNYVFFDSMPNDQEYYHSDEFTSITEDTQQAIYELCATISSQTNLIIIAISKIDYLENYEYIYRRRKDIAKATGAQFLDFKDILKHIYALLDCDINLLYETPTHPAAYLMKACGAAIGTALEAVPENSFANSSISFERNFSWQNLGQQAFELGEGSTITLSNSLMSETFLQIEEQQNIIFSTQSCCLGFYINYRSTNAYINLLSQDEVFQLNLASKTVKDKLLKIFIPIPKLAPLQKISLASERLPTCSTPVPHYKKANWIIDNPTLSIASIIFWNFRPKKWQQEIPNYENDYRWLTDQVKRAMSKTALSSHSYPYKNFRLVTHLGREIMYDTILNLCIQTNPSLAKFYPNPLLPINIRLAEHSKVQITTEIDGISHVISGFTGGLRVKNVMIGENLRGEISENFSLEKMANNKFAIKCDKFYLRASTLVLNGGLSLDRLNANLHETYEIKNQW